MELWVDTGAVGSAERGASIYVKGARSLVAHRLRGEVRARLAPFPRQTRR
jgi:hypothetical protein